MLFRSTLLFNALVECEYWLIQNSQRPECTGKSNTSSIEKDKRGDTASRDLVQSPLKSFFKDHSICLVRSQLQPRSIGFPNTQRLSVHRIPAATLLFSSPFSIALHWIIHCKVLSFRPSACATLPFTFLHCRLVLR